MAVQSKPLFLYSDFTKTPVEIIVDLINYCNGTTLAADTLTYGLPAVIEGKHNTVIKATTTAKSRYIGSASITYNRVQLTDFFHDVDMHVAINDDVALISDIIPLINSTYGLNLTSDDYIDGPLPDPSLYSDQDGLPFIMQAHPNSLIFIGEVTFYAVRYDVMLSSVVTNVYLDGFTTTVQ